MHAHEYENDRAEEAAGEAQIDASRLGFGLVMATGVRPLHHPSYYHVPRWQETPRVTRNSQNQIQDYSRTHFELQTI